MAGKNLLLLIVGNSGGGVSCVVFWRCNVQASQSYIIALSGYVYVEQKKEARSVKVLWIRDILVRIWIRGSVPLTNGSGSCYFRH